MLPSKRWALFSDEELELIQTFICRSIKAAESCYGVTAESAYMQNLAAEITGYQDAISKFTREEFKRHVNSRFVDAYDRYGIGLEIGGLPFDAGEVLEKMAPEVFEDQFQEWRCRKIMGEK